MSTSYTPNETHLRAAEEILGSYRISDLYPSSPKQTDDFIAEILARHFPAPPALMGGDAELLRELNALNIPLGDDAAARITALSAQVAELERENAELRSANDKRVEDFLSEQMCCSGHECGCGGATRIQQMVNEEAGQRIAELERWKAEALAVEASWDVQAVGKALKLPLGADIRKAILPAVTELERDKARLDWFEKFSIETGMLTVKLGLTFAPPSTPPCPRRPAVSDYPRTEKAVLCYSTGEPIYYNGMLIVPATFAIALERELTAANAEIARLRANTGCARNQTTTQFCAEAVDANKLRVDAERERDKWRKVAAACATAGLKPSGFIRDSAILKAVAAYDAAAKEDAK